MFFKGPVQDGLYPFHASQSPSQAGIHKVFAVTAKVSSSIWHQRLGHPSVIILNKLSAQSCIFVLHSKNKSCCSNCALGKCSKLPFVSASCNTSKPLEFIYTDVWGPISITSSHGYRYYVTFVDDYTK